MKIHSKKNNCQVVSFDSGAVRYVCKQYWQPSRVAQIEISILTSIKHDNIAAPCYLNNLTIVMPFYGPTLNDILPRLNTNAYHSIIHQIAAGLKCLHDHNIVHGDIKSDNIVIANDQIKIIDFGSAELNLSFITTELKSTITHRAPEAYANTVYRLNEKIDVWSLGIIVFEIYGNKSMFDFLCQRIDYNGDEQEIEQYVLSINFSADICATVPEKYTSCLSYEPRHRPSVALLIND